MEGALLQAVDAAGEGGVDSATHAAGAGAEHAKLVGTIKSLVAFGLVVAEPADTVSWSLTPEAVVYAEQGSPEAQVFAAVPADGLPLAELKKLFPFADVGFKQCMQLKALALEKGAEPRVVRKADALEDKAQALMQAVAAGEPVADADLAALKKRKLVVQEKRQSFRVTKGPKFALELKKPETDLTAEMMAKGTWKTLEFKPYNLVAGAGAPPHGGHLHPLLKVREQFRQIFLGMGFSEMPTNNFVESGFWNFDTLIQPQQHPARDAHDTFFMKNPAVALSAPEEYLERVKTMHEVGGNGSIGHRYHWKRAEADKNIMRTHTTAVSARMLYKLAQDTKETGFRPAKYFSVDRVFRNEAVDRTHLAEFHQVEGLVCDYGLTLGDLIGTLYQFFERLGMKKLRFKPAFNPYTEPSMEVFAYHEQLDKWMEVGNSGMFRPEMLGPMGFPDDVTVIAWGLSLERPTMILYDVDNIRDLFGTKVNLSMIKSNPVCKLGLAA